MLLAGLHRLMDKVFGTRPKYIQAIKKMRELLINVVNLLILEILPLFKIPFLTLKSGGLLFLFMSVYLSAYMCMNIRGRQKKVLDPAPRIGVTGSCEWLNLDAGNCTPVFWKNSRYCELLSNIFNPPFSHLLTSINNQSLSET